MRPGLNDMSLRPALSLLLLIACAPPPASPPTPTVAAPSAPSAVSPGVEAAAAAAAAEAQRVAELPHRVVFADRITYSYVLLLPGADLAAPTREELDVAVREAFPNNLDDEEVGLLRGLIARPIDESPASGPPLVELRVLADPDLSRTLEPGERASLATRGALLVLRAQYRNQHGVRGLRLLQTLVRVVAARRGALIHDPDTLETFGPAAFAARRLQTTLATRLSSDSRPAACAASAASTSSSAASREISLCSNRALTSCTASPAR